MASWDCTTCYDTRTIDQGGAEIPCPDCAHQLVTIKVTGLSHNIGSAYADEYRYAIASTGSSITFQATSAAKILADVDSVARYATRPAARRGKPRAGSWAVAIATRTRKAAQ